MSAHAFTPNMDDFERCNDCARPPEAHTRCTGCDRYIRPAQRAAAIHAAYLLCASCAREEEGWD